MDAETRTEHLVPIINPECNICFNETSNVITCGNEPCSFRSCPTCIETYNKNQCPHCQRHSTTFHNIINQNEPPQDFALLLNDRQFSNPDTTGCCLEIKHDDGVTEYKLCNCNPCIESLLMMTCCCCYIHLTGNIMNYFITGTLHLTPPPIGTCCTSVTGLGCICFAVSSCCCYLLEQQCQNTVLVTGTRYYRGTAIPIPGYMYMERGSNVPPATVVPLSGDIDLP